MLSLISIVDLVFLSFGFIFSAICDYRRRRGLPYPPPGLALDISKESSWLAYAKFAKEYGDVLSFHVFGQVIVVLNSIKATKDLFEKSGEIYSDCPVNPFYDMMEWGWFLPMAGYGESWRRARKILDHDLRPRAVTVYRPMQAARAHVLLTRMLESPGDWEVHIELWVMCRLMVTKYKDATIGRLTL